MTAIIEQKKTDSKEIEKKIVVRFVTIFFL